MQHKALRPGRTAMLHQWFSPSGRVKSAAKSQGAGAGSKTKGSECMAGGAPRKWKSVSAMQEAIDAYFKGCEGEPFIDANGDVVKDRNGLPVIINAKPPTITGLALALGFTGRQALLDYQARPEFADTITRAKARCEEYAESRLYDRDGANGAKFSLGCNFGWNSGEEKSGNPAALAELLTALKGSSDEN